MNQLCKGKPKMLPFLKKSKEASVSATPEVIVRESDNPEEMHDDDMLHTVASELVDAVHKKDAAGVVECLRAAFLILESEPHEEAELEMEGEE